MTAADDAYGKAQELIAQCIETRNNALNLANAGSALTRIPPEIADATQVKTLRLNATQITDLTPIAGMTGIKTLFLNNTQVTDLTPIAGMTGITTLDLSSTQVTDLTPIAGMTGITTLFLNNTQVTDLTPIAGMTGITTLFLSDTQITDLTPIAGMTGITTLALSDTQITDLTPIAGMTGIKTLYLSNTPVADLTPIAGMTGIKTLYLSNTPVADLTPIAGMTGITKLALGGTAVSDISHLPRDAVYNVLDLARTNVLDLRPLADLKITDEPGSFALRVTATPAATADPRIAEIDAMKDHAARVKTLQTYLKNWVPPREDDSDVPGNIPAEDALFTLINSTEQIEIAASNPTEAERDERLKAVLHDRLKPRALELAQLAGNQYMRLATRARALANQVDRPFEDLDMLLVHLEIEDLNDRARAGQESDLAFTPEIIAALNDVLRLGPGLTLDNPDVERLIERTNRLREEPQTEEVKAAHDTLSLEIERREDLFGERLRTLEAANTAAQTSDVADAAQIYLHRNVFLRIMRVSIDTASMSTLSIGGLSFIFAQWPSVYPIVLAYGQFFADWFFTSIASLPQIPAGLHGLPKASDDPDIPEK